MSGQILVLFQLILIVVLVLAGLVIDVGLAYLAQHRMQTGADAAALAGVQEYGFYANEAEPVSGDVMAAIGTAAESYALENGAWECMWELDQGADRLRVVTRRGVPAFFLRLVGIEEIRPSALAVAAVSPVGALGNLLPMAVAWPDQETLDQWISGVPVELWAQGGNTPPPGAGNFGWLDWDGVSPNANELAYCLRHPESSGFWKVDQWVPGGPGVTAARQVRDAIEELIRRCDEGEHFFVIGYDGTRGQGSNFEYRIAGFIAFEITGYHFTGRDKTVEGQFKRLAIQADGHGRQDLGLYAAILVE